jgi:DNA-binding NarL/FixJ family response regulator
MATGPSEATSTFSDYEKLAAEYRACEINCQASLDQLRAAERELRSSEPTATRLIDLRAPAELEQALQRIADRNRPQTLEALASLSPRERNVFELIGQGLPTSAIAGCLHIASSTVETYRERLKTKLGIETGLELTRFAILWFARK